MPLRPHARWLGIPCILLGLGLALATLFALSASSPGTGGFDWLYLPALLIPLAIAAFAALSGYHLLRHPSFGWLRNNLAILCFTAVFVLVARLRPETSATLGLFTLSFTALLLYLLIARTCGRFLLTPPLPALGAWVSCGIINLLAVLLWMEAITFLTRLQPSPGEEAPLRLIVMLLLPLAIALAFRFILLRLLTPAAGSTP